MESSKKNAELELPDEVTSVHKQNPDAKEAVSPEKIDKVPGRATSDGKKYIRRSVADKVRKILRDEKQAREKKNAEKTRERVKEQSKEHSKEQNREINGREERDR